MIYNRRGPGRPRCNRKENCMNDEIVELFDAKGGDYLTTCPTDEAEIVARRLRESGFNPTIYEGE